MTSHGVLVQESSLGLIAAGRRTARMTRREPVERRDPCPLAAGVRPWHVPLRRARDAAGLAARSAQPLECNRPLLDLGDSLQADRAADAGLVAGISPDRHVPGRLARNTAATISVPRTRRGGSVPGLGAVGVIFPVITDYKPSK